jgi:hypothetical protein
VPAALLFLFLFRLGFGLSSEFWSADERQIYLLGLKFYTTGQWPYFGPDLVLAGYDHTFQLPGALQSLLVGLPFFVLPLPEAPILLLNLLSFAALSLLCAYACRRLPELPAWFVWSLTMTLPWTLQYSTHVVNPSYVLFGSVIFFVGALETTVFLDAPLLSVPGADFMMGFAILWIAQLHLSWVLLLPIAAVALGSQVRRLRRRALPGFGAFLFGALVSGSVLLPTFLVYGPVGGMGRTQVALHLSPLNLGVSAFFGTLAKMLSFASYEVPRFLGDDPSLRLAFLGAHLWLAPFAVFTLLVGLLQPLAMVALFFLRGDTPRGWTGVKAFMLGTFLMTYLSFLFTVRQPWALTFYVTFPVAMIYSLYCWSRVLKGPRTLILAKVAIASGMVFHAGLALIHLPERSIYRERNTVVRAVALKDYRILGARRADALY